MKIKFTLSTNKVGSECSTTLDVDDDDWNEMGEQDQHEYALEMFLDDALLRLGEWGWEIAS